MAHAVDNPQFQAVIDAVEALTPEDQTVLVEVIRLRLAERERARVVADAAEARTAYRAGAVKRGSAADLLAEADE